MAPDRLANYVPVSERVSQAQGALKSVHADPPVMLTDTMGYIRVTVVLNDDRSATGTASFRLDIQGKSAQATNPIEDCETSALGRALAFLGYESARGIASREEVQEAERRATYQPQRQAPRPPAPQGRAAPQANQDDVHSAETKFYEHVGDAIDAQTWADVQKWLGTKPDKPTTVEGWRDAYRLVASTLKARQSESAPPEGIAA